MVFALMAATTWGVASNVVVSTSASTINLNAASSINLHHHSMLLPALPPPATLDVSNAHHDTASSSVLDATSTNTSSAASGGGSSSGTTTAAGSSSSRGASVSHIGIDRLSSDLHSNSNAQEHHFRMQLKRRMYATGFASRNSIADATRTAGNRMATNMALMSQIFSPYPTIQTLAEELHLASMLVLLVWFGLVWFGLVWFGLVWFGLVWFGLVWFGLVWLSDLTV
jgi:hypothetical protein